MQFTKLLTTLTTSLFLSIPFSTQAHSLPSIPPREELKGTLMYATYDSAFTYCSAKDRGRTEERALFDAITSFVIDAADIQGVTQDDIILELETDEDFNWAYNVLFNYYAEWLCPEYY